MKAATAHDTADCAGETDVPEEVTATHRLMAESRGLAGRSVEILLALRGKQPILSDSTKLRILRNLARDGAHQTDSPACLATYKRVLAELENVQ